MSAETSLVEWNARVHRARGIGRWRRLYLEFLKGETPDSVLEMGSGDPSFLLALSEVPRRVALDGNATLAEKYAVAGVEFHALDFDHEELPAGLACFDVAVCSDVFEHLIYPLKTLLRLRDILAKGGVLYSHVPNEFQLHKTLKIMIGRRPGVYHHDAEEWNDPHLRRFTDLGYQRFLKNGFEYNLKIGDILESSLRRMLRRMQFNLPYCLELGPTYASTNDQRTYQELTRIKRSLLRNGI